VKIPYFLPHLWSHSAAAFNVRNVIGVSEIENILRCMIHILVSDTTAPFGVGDAQHALNSGVVYHNRLLT